MTLPFASAGLLIAASLAASWNDACHRRIPNWLCAATAIAGLVVALVLSGLPALGGHALHAAIALVIGMLLFKFGIIGGGDAKFYAAMAAWFALPQAVALLVSVTLCGFVLLVVWFGHRRATGKPIGRPGGEPSEGLPYGIAIGAGAVVAKLITG